MNMDKFILLSKYFISLTFQFKLPYIIAQYNLLLDSYST